MSLSGHILIEHDVYYKRIESWWSRLRNFKTEWWIQLFKVSNYIHVGVCMLYSYLMHRTWMRRACLTLQIYYASVYCLFLSPSLYYLYFAISRHLAAYVFLPILAEELKEFKKRWNRHRIRGIGFQHVPVMCQMMYIISLDT